ncbi:MAG: excinuclease ABC subunit UvrA [Actinobacteria bacterium]|nr:MAG: excinuclease ABC subunit UvrA [Actinomycetota bacterium]
MDKIVIRGAREHNLKNVNLELPRDSLVVMTGLSGSGKSSLAFDTLYAEGQRRYVESLSAYARQFLGQMEKPDVDHIDGLSPAVSIDQKSTTRNPRSTVGTVTEIYDYLRLLYARIGVPHCYRCGREISRQSSEQIVDQVLALPQGTKFLVLAPVVRGRKGEYRQVLEDLRLEGFARVRVDGELRELSEEITLDKKRKHSIDVVVDRLVMKPEIRRRLADSIELALGLAEGLVAIAVVQPGTHEEGERAAPAPGEELTYSQQFACVECGISYEELSPRMFSFNSPYGACPRCGGLGSRQEIDPELVVPHPEMTLRERALAPWNPKATYYFEMLNALAEHYGFSLDTPFEELPEKIRDIILYGTGGERIRYRYRRKGGRYVQWYGTFEGVIRNLERRYRETESEGSRAKIEEFMRLTPCAQCHGARLKPEVLAVTVGDRNIWEFTRTSARAALEFVEGLQLTKRQEEIGRRVLKEIKERLRFLVDVGLDYLTLDRAAGTLAGGEAQRIRLATQIGSSLVGVLYILDEPSIGLHQRDNKRLINTLTRLRDLGNTVIVVEHDEETIRTADFLVDIGPGAGEHGGEIVATGGVADLERTPASITGKYLSGELVIPVPVERKAPDGRWIEVIGAREHNLKEIDVPIPLGLFVCVTGVSGSGKSTLVSDILSRAMMRRIYRSKERPGRHDRIEGLDQIDKVIEIDQSPIGRTPRSNPATYTGVFDDIRQLYAQTNEAKLRGYMQGRFSFNVRGGRCENCQGEGQIKIEMHFLPDVYVKCEVCKGARYNRETLQVKFKGKSIADVLAMSVEEALDFFENIPKIRRKLQTLYDVGLGYIRLGQPATTLSGGEAQRVKLSSEIGKRETGRTFYILDEPTTGLHFADIEKLLGVLRRLVEGGNTVLVIEHNLDVIKTADWLIDLGPEGGDEGGHLVATGMPEQVAKVKASYTGQFLKAAASAGSRPAPLPAATPHAAGPIK